MDPMAERRPAFEHDRLHRDEFVIHGTGKASGMAGFIEANFAGPTA